MQKPDELEGSPYGRRKQMRDQQPEQDRRKQEMPPIVQQSSSIVRPPSPPVPPPNDCDEMVDSLPDKRARQKEVSKQALSSILSSVTAKQGQHEEEDPGYSFSSASSTDEMLPPPPLPVEPPPRQYTNPGTQLMTSTLFDKFSTKTASSTTGKGKQLDRDRLSSSPDKAPSPTSRAAPADHTQPSMNYTQSTSTYGLPNPYDYYHQPVSKKYSPEVPSHPFSPGPNDLPTKSALSTIFQGQTTPSSTASESPPTYKTMAKGELRSIEISGPVLVSSSNQNVRPAGYDEYQHHHQHQQQHATSPTGRAPKQSSNQRQPLSASSLHHVVYEYEVPSAPPAPVSQGTQGSAHERSRPKPLTLLHESSEGAQRIFEEILTQEMDQDSSSPTGQSSESSRPGQRSGTESGAGKKPLSAAAAVAEILANRQPLSVRISIQKHKTETSYKKSQSFGPEAQSGNEGRNDKSKGGGGGKKSGNPFSESSL